MDFIEKNKAGKSPICCDACDGKKIKHWLTDKRDIKFGEREKNRMNIKNIVSSKWQWRPKRWWIFLIVFWLFSTSGGKYLFGIEPKTTEQAEFVTVMTFLVLIFAAITDREHTIPKRIFWVIIASMFYSVISLFLYLLVGNEAGANIFASLIVVVIAMRLSKIFVEPAIDIKIVEQQKEDTKISTPAV